MSAEEKRPLPGGWEWTTIGGVATTSSGGTPSRKHAEYYGGSIPWVKSGELGDSIVSKVDEFITEEGLNKSSAKIFPSGTALVALYGATVGKTGLLAIDAATNQAVCAILPRDGSFEAKYMIYWLRSQRNKLIDQSVGGAQPNISQGIVKAFPFPLAPLPEQKRIVAEIEKQLTRLDQAVASLMRAQANLQRYKASVLKAACEGNLVPQDLDDESAEILLQRILAERRRQWEEQEWGKLEIKAQKKVAQVRRKAHGRPARLSDLEPAEWQDIAQEEYGRYLPKNDKWKEKYKEPVGVETAELPPLPDGWTWASLEQLLAGIQAGKSPKTKNRPIKPGEFGVIKVSAMSWGDFLPEENKALIENRKPGNMPSINAGDLLLSRANTVELVGAVVLVKQDYPDLLLSDKSLRLVPSSNEVNRQYLVFALRTPWVREVFEKQATGTSDSMRNLSQSKILSAPISLPPLVEQERIVDEMERRLSVIAANEKAIAADLARAERLRQSILQQAFSGRLVSQEAPV